MNWPQASHSDGRHFLCVEVRHTCENQKLRAVRAVRGVACARRGVLMSLLCRCCVVVVAVSSSSSSSGVITRARDARFGAGNGACGGARRRGVACRPWRHRVW